MVKRVILFAFLLVSCSKDIVPERANAGLDQCATFRKMATYCLRDWLTGEDSGGTWEQIGTTPEDISNELIGENPCVSWDNKACGQYHLMYIVGDQCCRDTAFVNPLKCCLVGGSSCN